MTLSRRNGMGFQTSAGFVVAEDNVPILNVGWGFSGYGSVFPSTSVIEIQALAAKGIHEKFIQLSTKRRDRLTIPIRKLRDYSTTGVLEEAAIDLRLALESLYLPEIEQGELKYRLALRAALFGADRVDERQVIRKDVKDAYDLGSNAVHTGQFGKNILKAVENPGRTLERVAEVVRRTILRHIDNPNQDWAAIEIGKPPES